MSPTIIILLLIAVAVGVVVWLARKPSTKPDAGPRDTDTGWNDPVTPASTTTDTPPRDETRP